ncbi:MAG TPA: prepilin-type N-terminal cleavage/methylation domain-containing protein [Phycisphaerae bacterium]|jgi:prepilin-type N-terminal cleavage/methylation domain-containing protein
MDRRTAHRRAGVTLVEILIVLIVLSVLAAVVVPRFSAASTDMRRAELLSQLETLRGQLRRYEREHSGARPPRADFESAMTSRAHDDAARAAAEVLEAYLPSIPKNPYNGLNTIGDPAAPLGTTGWIYDDQTGDFKANDSAADRAW